MDVGEYSAPAFGDWASTGKHDMLVGSRDGRLYFFSSKCDPSNGGASDICSSAGFCKGNSCQCLASNQGSDCSLCSQFHYHTSGSFVCTACPGLGSSDGVCSRRGICIDDEAAADLAGVPSKFGRGTGSCECFSPFTGAQCNDTNCPRGHELLIDPSHVKGSEKYPLLHSCEPCPSGKYKDHEIDNMSCKPCEVGRYQTGTGASECKVCENGRFQAHPGSNSPCQSCPPGTKPSIDSGDCDTCPAGTSSLPGSTTCITCNPGYYAERGSAICQQCPAGKHPSDNAAYCESCPAGKFSDAGGNCTFCPQGRVATNSGQPSCTACTSGKESSPDGTICMDCKPGKFSSDGKTCRLCEAGRMASTADSDICQPCSTGKFAPDMGSKACSVCEAGTFQDREGQKTCKACELGVSTDDFTSCIPLWPLLFIPLTALAAACSFKVYIHWNRVKLRRQRSELAKTAVAETKQALTEFKLPNFFVPPSKTQAFKLLLEALKDKNRALDEHRSQGRYGWSKAERAELSDKIDMSISYMQAYLKEAKKTWSIEVLEGQAESSVASTYAKTYNTVHELIREKEKDDYAALPSAVDNCRKRMGNYPDGIDRIEAPSARLITLYEQASRALSSLGMLLQYICSKTQSEMKLAPLKGLPRVIEKTVMRPDSGVPWDIVRGQIICKTMGQIAAAVQLMANEENIVILTVNDRFAKPANGWADVGLYFFFKGKGTWMETPRRSLRKTQASSNSGRSSSSLVTPFEAPPPSTGQEAVEGVTGGTPLDDQVDDAAVVAEVQIVHDNLMLVREQMGAHDSYDESRFAAELRRSWEFQKASDRSQAAASSGSESAQQSSTLEASSEHLVPSGTQLRLQVEESPAPLEESTYDNPKPPVEFDSVVPLPHGLNN
eukprot:TRINITY_DN14767_c0_g1_i1.p1 TRINITY_DN14767_c0_g1~~TRINITY_DN14767_c0_g1_i1.p1  ORF type:complete len:892 (+),score=137.27 TRINITY_DN14767_c0_g1_i1:324-2999(+)